MSRNSGWTRQQLLVAFNLYCQLPFGKLHSRNPYIVKAAGLIGRTPAALAMKLTNIASLDPAITSTGRKGLSGASAADREMWEEMQNNWEIFVIDMAQAMQVAGINQEIGLGDEPDDDGLKVDYTGSDRLAQTKTRVGQEFFRKSVLSAYQYKCCITGLSVPRLLVASHIVPWKDDKKNRLNPSNGLCLSMLHDKAFDAGFITITDELTVRVSKKYYMDNDTFYLSALLGYDGADIALPEKFQPHKEFLDHHRNHIFEKVVPFP